ncbi:MAG: ABC transporter permease subunit [Raoultibacter sp.]
MTIFMHELKQNAKMIAIWAIAIGGMIVLCMALFPEMEKQSEDLNAAFASMGVFTEAFGMDKISIADPMGFFGLEGGNILGIGGAFFAAYLGIRMLSKEETEHTAEFLLTHPLSRFGVVLQKLAAVVAGIVVLNAVCVLCSIGSFAMIGETPEWDAFWLFFAAQVIMQLEIAFLCFAVSAVLGRGSVGVGLGFAAILYFLNIVANLSDAADPLRYITPFAYADAANIIADASLDGALIACGIAYGIVALIIAFAVYTRKDIAV